MALGQFSAIGVEDSRDCVPDGACNVRLNRAIRSGDGSTPLKLEASRPLPGQLSVPLGQLLSGFLLAPLRLFGFLRR